MRGGVAGLVVDPMGKGGTVPETGGITYLGACLLPKEGRS